jgi:glycosyltransferase involved in cell wall biosynthesis
MTPKPALPVVFIWQGYTHGGVATVTSAIANALHQAGVPVVMGAYQKDPKSTLPYLIFREPRFIPTSFRSFWTSLIWRWRYASQFQAVYTHTAGAWKTKHNLLFVHDAADLDERIGSSPDSLHRIAFRLWRFLYLTLCLKKTTAIFSATQAFTSYLVRHNIPKDAIHPTSSWYDDTIFTYQPRIRPHAPLRLVFIGNPAEPGKNFEYIRQNWYQKPDIHVSIIGSHDPATDHNFTFLGLCAPITVARTLHQADICVIPSKVEGFSIALLEAVACGIPCLVHKKVLNAEVRSLSNIMPFALTDNPQTLLTTITRKYSDYTQHDPRIKQFAQSKVLTTEVNTIQKYLAKKHV